VSRKTNYSEYSLRDLNSEVLVQLKLAKFSLKDSRRYLNCKRNQLENAAVSLSLMGRVFRYLAEVHRIADLIKDIEMR